MLGETQPNNRLNGNASGISSLLRSTNGALSGAVGFALCICSLEAHRFPVVQQVSMYSSVVSTTLVLVTLLLLVAYFRFARTKVLHRSIAVIAAGVAGTICLYLYYSIELTSPAGKMAVYLFNVFNTVLLAIWVESLYRKRESVSAAVFIGSLPIVFALQALVGLLSPAVAKGTCALLPVMSALFWMMSRVPTPLAGALFAGTLSDDAPRNAARTNPTPRAFLLLALLAFCCGSFFGKMHLEWLPSQEAWGVIPLQLSSASGALVAALVLIAVQALPARRTGIVAVECLLIAFTLFSVYLSTFSADGIAATLYLIPLNTAQKITLYLLFFACLSIPRKSARMTVFCLLFASYKAGFLFLSGVQRFTALADAPNLEGVVFALTLAVAIALLVIAIAAPSSLPTALTAVAANATGDETATPDDMGESTTAPYKEIAFYFLFAQKYSLTQREIEILPLLARMHTAKEISEELTVSHATAKTHIRNIYGKLDVHSQKDLVKLVDSERTSLLEHLPQWSTR